MPPRAPPAREQDAERWPSGRRRWTGIPVTSSRVFVGSNPTLSANDAHNVLIAKNNYRNHRYVPYLSPCCGRRHVTKRTRRRPADALPRVVQRCNANCRPGAVVEMCTRPLFPHVPPVPDEHHIVKRTVSHSFASRRHVRFFRYSPAPGGQRRR